MEVIGEILKMYLLYPFGKNIFSSSSGHKKKGLTKLILLFGNLLLLCLLLSNFKWGLLFSFINELESNFLLVYHVFFSVVLFIVIFPDIRKINHID